MRNKISCCVLNCKNTKKNRRVHFYRFPEPELNLDQRKKWIAAVNRINVDGSPWYPSPTDKLCSAHFLNGQKSHYPDNINYVPSIFPLGHTKIIIDETFSDRHQSYMFQNKLREISNSHSIEEVSEVKTPTKLEEYNTGVSEGVMETRSMTKFGSKDIQIKSALENRDGSTPNANSLMGKETFVGEQSITDLHSAMNKLASLEECRACLQKIDKQTAYNLFEAWFTPWAVRGAIIADDLSKFADVEISELDKYSKVICPKCYSRLADACTFMITVQMSDSLLRQRVCHNNTNTTNETSWPQPIMLNKSGNRDAENRIEIEIKQEVLSEDENGVNVDEDWEHTMDIKIEPEEISAPVQSNTQVNGALSRDETTNSNGSSSKFEQEYLDDKIKQERLSGDELLEAVPDLPLDCMLCFKVFNSVSGLKAHVISQHSYGTVKRKAESCPSPVKSKIQAKEYVCNSCNQSFATSTDLMVHGASHSEHVCYVCDRKFNSFKQLTRHGPRCQKKNGNAARRDHTRPPTRPQQLLQPVKNSRKAQKHNKTEERETILEILPIENIVSERVQELVKTQKMDIDSPQTQIENKLKSKATVGSIQEPQELEVVKNTPDKKEPENRLSANEIKEEPMKIEIQIGASIEKIQEPLETRLSELETEEVKGEQVLIESQNDRSSEKMEVEPTEEIKGEPKQESQIRSKDNKDSRTELSHKSNSSSEDKPSIPSPGPTTCNSLHIINHDELSYSKTLVETTDGNFEIVPSLPNQDPTEIIAKISSDTIEESRIEPFKPLSAEIKTNIGQTTEYENVYNNVEEKSPTIDEINEMKVHLAINPLDESSALFENEMDIRDIECGKSENCEQKLVSVISEQDDI